MSEGGGSGKKVIIGVLVGCFGLFMLGACGVARFVFYVGGKTKQALQEFEKNPEKAARRDDREVQPRSGDGLVGRGRRHHDDP